MRKTRKTAKGFSTKAFKNRLSKLGNAKREEDWFSAFTNAVTYFEHYGYWRVRFCCLRNKIELTNKAEESLKRFGASDIALILRILNLIDNETYSRMKKIIEERNKIVHPGQKGIRYVDTKKKDEVLRLLEDAKSCLMQLTS